MIDMEPSNIVPAERVRQVQEYYFSRKLKEVAKMNAEGRHKPCNRKSRHASIYTYGG